MLIPPPPALPLSVWLLENLNGLHGLCSVSVG